MANFGLTQTEVELMIEALQKQGKSEAFDTLFKTYLLKGYKSIPLKRGIPLSWVEDCNMEAIVRFQRALIRKKFTFEVQGADLENYFKVLYSNYCISFIRSNWKELGLNEPNWNIEPIPEEYTEGLSEDATLELKKAIEQLCEDCRERLRLFYWRGWDHDEIAAKMGQNGENPRNASASALRHCRMRLKAILKLSKFSW